MGLGLSAHITWLFTEYPYLERIAAAREAGFGRIETAWPLAAADRDGLAAALADAGVTIALLNCPAGDTAAGERGFVNDPRRRAEAERGFHDAAELAERVGARSLNLLVGRALADLDPAEQRESIVQALRALGPQAAARGLRLLIEPANVGENPGYLAPTPAAVAELIELAGCEGLGLLLDVYHVACEGIDPLAAIDAHRELIGHVQLSDWPGRGAPGTGTLDVWGILARLAAVGYGGAVGLEYDPRGPTAPSLARFIEDPRARALL